MEEIANLSKKVEKLPISGLLQLKTNLFYAQYIFKFCRKHEKKIKDCKV